MLRIYRMFILLMPVLLAACAVGPDYRKPCVPDAISKAFITRAKGVDPAAPLPDDWWRLYNDPVLDDLIAKAFAANTDLRVARANLKQAWAVLEEYRGKRFASTTLSGSTGYGNTTQLDPTGSTDVQWAAGAGVAVSWEADLFGRVENAVKAAHANVQAVAAARDAVRVTVAGETTRAYCNACSWAMARDIAAQSLEIAQKSLALVTRKERAGAANMLDVERAATAVENARAKIAPLGAKQRTALLKLAALLGQTPGHLPKAACLGTTPPEPVAALPVGDGAKLLRNRPDLREAERQLAAATAKIGVAMADLYPTISLGASANFFRNDYVKNNESFTWSLGPVPMVSWHFPNRSLARARLHRAEARGEALLAAFDGKVVTALKEVEQALVNFSAEQARLETLIKAKARAEKAWHIADMRYRAGSASWLEALTTQQDLLDARAYCAVSVQRVSSARIDLFKALGCGWKSAAQADDQ